jgi:hypothetical protein
MQKATGEGVFICFKMRFLGLYPKDNISVGLGWGQEISFSNTWGWG